MALRRALVVDDSRAARVALKKLLQDHDLDVVQAESAETALELLQDEHVDVIFMDHTMPGMDGLEAVSAIKANPDTATIPVMMYTTREGEVYVGQARALGAVGVMPKNVQPHQLFEMLKDLGLVKERREAGVETGSLDVVAKHEVPEEMAQPGMSLESLVSRMLEDQHLTLRSDILRSQRTFAKQVAKEIVLEQARAEEVLADLPTEEAVSAGGFWRSAAAVVLVVGLTVTGFLAVQFKNERDAALARLDAASSATIDANAEAVSGLEGELDEALDVQTTLRNDALSALVWAAGYDNGVGVNAYAYDEHLADKIATLMIYLDKLGYTGEVKLTSHLGRFCLVRDESLGVIPAGADLSVLDCEEIGHPLALSTRISERLSVPFSRLLRDYSEGSLRLSLVALDASESEPLYDYPDTSAAAAHWNQIAVLNNRVEIELVDGSPVAAAAVPQGELTVSRTVR